MASAVRSRAGFQKPKHAISDATVSAQPRPHRPSSDPQLHRRDKNRRSQARLCAAA